MNYSKAIRVARSLSDVSQKTLAEKIQVDPSLVSLLESEKRTPSLATVEKIAAALGVPFHLFMLLACEQHDLDAVSGPQIEELGKTLTRILFSSDARQNKNANRTQRRKAKHPDSK
jgi:transcriptional regulator with XRE-family HTH domain